MTSTTSSPARRATPWIVTIAVVVVLAIIAGVWWMLASRTNAQDSAPAGALPAETQMGVVEIATQDLDTMTAFYRDVLALEVLEETTDAVTLGTAGNSDTAATPLIRLDTSATVPQDPRSAGLYHSAILYPDRASLAQALVRVAQLAPESFQGSSDHAVSLAFYIGDPESNGVELYVDRPRDEWVWENGQVVMGSAYLDPNLFIQQELGGEASGAATMGHVHLRVGDLPSARAFYADVLGFDVTAESQGALFYSAGGYHHHLATNTWQSAGAGVRGEDAGLRSITIAVPAASDLDAIADRLAEASVAYETTDGMLVTADPWGNGVRFVTP